MDILIDVKEESGVLRNGDKRFSKLGYEYINDVQGRKNDNLLCFESFENNG